MKVVYVDTSVLISIFFGEPGRNNARFLKLLNHAAEVVSAALVEAEFLSAVAREGADFESGLKLLRQVSLVRPDLSLCNELKQVFSTGHLRGADAYHLACALFFGPDMF